MKPFDLNGLKTYELQARPSQVFVEDLGQPLAAANGISDWLDSLPRQLAAVNLRKVRDHICPAHAEGRTVAVALGGHVIKTGCGAYLVGLIEHVDITTASMY